jgi:O-antigen ligase
MTMWPSPRRKSPRDGGAGAAATIGFTLLYLLFCLQQVVIGQGLGEGISLGSTSIRLVAVAAAIIFFLKCGVPIGLRTLLLSISACLCVLAVSVALSDHRLIALKFGVRYATQLLMLWCIFNLVTAFPNLRGALGRAAIAALWISLAIGLGTRWGIEWVNQLGLLFHEPEALRYMPRIVGLYEHPATFGAIAVVVAVMATQLREELSIGLPALAAAYAGAATALFFTEARSPIVPLLLLAGTFAATRRGRQRQLALLVLLLLSALVGVVIWLRYAELTSASHESLATMFSLGRTYIWQGAVDAWLGRPWWGLGPGVFQFLTPDFTGGRFLRGELHAHNLVLAILSETGLMGLIAMTGLAAALLVPVWAEADNTARRRWVFIWSVVVLGMGLFDFYLPFYAFSLHISLAAALLCVPVASAKKRAGARFDTDAYGGRPS